MLLETLSVLLATIAVLFLPGATVAAAAGLRLPLVLACAPLTTYGLAAAAATAAHVTDLSWGPGYLAAEAAALSAVLVALRAVGGRDRPRLPRIRPLSAGDAAVVAGVLLGALLSGSALLTGFGSLDRPNQDWDYTFHANATRFIADTGQVAASALRVVNDWEAESFFYPNAHAAIGAVVRDLTGAPVFEVLNGQTLLIGAVAGLGLAVLLRDLGAPLAVAAATPVLLAGFAGFPYDVIWRGPLLPYATGLAVTPAFLVLVRTAARERSLASVLLAALGGAALFGLQPSTALSAAVLAGLMVGQGWWSHRGIDVREAAALALAGALAIAAAAPAVLGSVRAGTGQATANWAAIGTPLQAVVDLLLLRQSTPGPSQYWLVPLVVAGLLAVRSARYLWWWLVGGALAGLVYVLTASSDAALVEALTRPWWNDRWRFAALTVLGMAPLAAHGAWRLALTVTSLLARARSARAPGSTPPRRALALGLVLAAVVLLPSGLPWRDNSDRVASAYQSDRYLDDAELRAMAWLARRVQPGETVMNDSGDGSAYLYATEGVRPLFGHLLSSASHLGPTQTALLRRFSCLDTDPVVRDAVTELRIRYVFLGSGFVRPYKERAQGLRQLADSPSLRLVYDQDGVQVHEVALGPVAADPVEQCARRTG